MNKDTYTSMINWIKQQSGLALAIRTANKLLTAVVYVSFIIFVLWLIINNGKWINVLIITGVPFVCLSVVRKMIGRKRPYEIYGIEPLIEREKKGDSFPSRHIFSAFVIATTMGFINIYLGIAIGIIGLLVAILRVIGGVHFISDVMAGMILGIAGAVIGVSIIGI